MKSQSFGNFQVGIVDNPSIEDKGGFEFASGMDIFSEPGVLKACSAMADVSYGASATPTAVPLWMTEAIDSLGAVRGYVAAGSKLLESTDGSTFNLFRTNTNGTIKGLGAWSGWVIYVADGKIGIVQIGVSGSASDSYYSYGSYTASDFYPVIIQGGTLKVGAGRYIASMDESLTVTPDVFKLPDTYRTLSLVSHFSRIYMGTKLALGAGSATVSGSSVFAWGGTILSTGSALPDNAYEMKLRGMPALFSDSRYLYGFPDHLGEILIFDGAGFTPYRKLHYVANKGQLTINPGAVDQYGDSILFAGDTDVVPGVYQMQNRAICQSFVPSAATPGVDASVNIGFVKTAFNGTVYIGYSKSGAYHIEKSTSNKQNGAVVKTLWHRLGTDKLKRHGGIKLNLKPMAANTSAKVEYRTDRNASFTDSGVTVSSSNQGKPVIFGAQPRSREIQYQLTYTTSTTNTPELLSYDPLFEVLNTVRS